jgi:predicted Zn-dependent peptidase
VLATLLLLAAQAGAAAELPPPVGPPRPFALPAKQEFRLPNGFAATLVPFGAVPKVTVLLTLRAGAIDEGAKDGIADLVAELVREGAGARDASALAEEVASMGGALESNAGPDQMTFGVDVLAERAVDAIALVADLVRRPHLPAAELPRLKADLARQIAIEHSQAQNVASEAFEHLLWGAHPYGRELPDRAAIAALGIDDVRGFVARNFGAARTHLYVAGRFDAPAVARAIRARFGDWAAGQPAAVLPASASRERVVRLIDRPGAAQTTLLMGLGVPAPAAPGFMNLSVANALFGGSLLARLDRNLREEKGWTYGAYSHITPLASGPSMWQVSTDVNAPDTVPAIEELFRELGRLREEPPSADELRATQNFRAGNFLIGAAGRGGLVAQLAFCDLEGLPDDWLVNYGARVYAVTPAEVTAAAAAYLDPAAMTLVVVGDLAKLRPALRASPALAGARFID